MRLLLIGALLWGALPVSAQTARDTAHVRSTDSVIAAKMRTEASRTNVRKTVIRALADTLERNGRALLAAPSPPPSPTTPPAPVASFAVSCALLQCAFNASASAGVRLSFAWDCGAFPNCTPGSVSSFSFSYPHEGPRTAGLTVRDSLGRSASTTRTFTVPGIPTDTTTPPPPPPPPTTDTTSQPVRAELPRVVPVFTVPKATAAKMVAPPADLQAVLNAAQPGDSIVLNGAWTGNYVLPGKACNGWITITSAAPKPAEGQRVTPALAAGYAKIISPDNQPALRTTNPTCQWRIVGIEITGTLAQASVQYGLLALGDGGWIAGGDTQGDPTKVPQQIIVDRVYIHGSPTLNVVRCLSLNSGATVVVNSWLSECHAAGFDSQAICGWNGPGPYLIENNYLEGAGENVMFGGADPGISGLVPSDITIRRNHFFKPLTWRGSAWSVKNLFELKSAQRVLVEGNVFENNWPAAQEGMAIVIKSNANGCQCAFEGTRDLTFRYNRIRNAAVGLNLQAADNSYGWLGFVHVQRVTVEHNLFTEIGAEGRASLMLFTHDGADWLIAHNTFVHHPAARGLAVSVAYSDGAARRVAWADNVLTAPATYALYYDGGLLHSAALTAFANDRSWSFQRNVVGGVDPQYVPLNPTASWYPSTVAGIGLAPDYSLSATSAYKGKGLNGTDPGADIAAITSKTAGVVVAP